MMICRSCRVAVMVLMVVCGGACVAQRAAAPKGDESSQGWMNELALRHQKLIDDNGPGTDAALREQLLTMYAADQKARGIDKSAAKGPSAKGPMHVAANMAAIDTALTAQLKQLVSDHGWPTIALVGYDASNGAMTILAHTQDVAWRKTLLPTLEYLADNQKIDGGLLALVIDKQLVSEGKLQRYGTQFKFVDGEMAMYGVEDPGGLDKRRALVFLMPEEAYKQTLAGMYHLKAGNKIVMAQAPK